MSRDFEFIRRDGKDVVRIAARGREVLSNPMLNFGTGFTEKEREGLGLLGLLPTGVMTMEQQLQRVYRQYQAEPTDLAKYLYLNTMQDRNEVLFYRLISEHLDEMLPIIYTPTIGHAIEEYSHWFHKPRGVYLNIDQPELIDQMLTADKHRSEDVDLVVVTDSEGILGIGDQGVGGVAITIGKLSVYTAAAGIHPHRVLPIVLDTGTDNLQLLNDPAYLGVRHSRVRGAAYDAFIEAFVESVTKHYPQALLHWEDFAAGNATRILNKYRDQICTFNDDIQGTAAVVTAAVLSAVDVSQTKLADHRIVVHGAGSAGMGIVDLLVDVMVMQGMDRDEALTHFWGLGSRGLLVKGGRVRDFQEVIARDPKEVAGWKVADPKQISLTDVVKNVKPTILIGSSAQEGAFTRQIVEMMAENTERPIIMPLSNPTARAEAKPADLIDWTQGRALIATGSPFDPVHYDGVDYEIAQANNALVFPGIGLGVAVAKASRITNTMISAAATAVAQAVTERHQGASLLPSISQLRAVSARVAIAVIAAAQAEGVAQAEVDNPIQQVYDAMWKPMYPQVEVVDKI